MAFLNQRLSHIVGRFGMDPSSWMGLHWIQYNIKYLPWLFWHPCWWRRTHHHQSCHSGRGRRCVGKFSFYFDFNFSGRTSGSHAGYILNSSKESFSRWKPEKSTCAPEVSVNEGRRFFPTLPGVRLQETVVHMDRVRQIHSALLVPWSPRKKKKKVSS